MNVWGGVYVSGRCSLFPLQKRNGAMDPDAFHACLNSMGYDLVRRAETGRDRGYARDAAAQRND